MPLKVLVISNYKGPMMSVRPEAEMVLRLKRAGLEVDVMTFEDADYARIFKDNGMQVFHYEPAGKLNFHNIRQIRSVLKAGRYDILHVFNNRAMTNAVHASLGLSVKLLAYRGFTGHVHWYKPTSYLSYLHPKVSRITCVSNGVRSQVRNQLFFNKKKAVTVYKGHDMDWYKDVTAVPRSDMGIPDNAFIVGCVANARPMKGVQYLLKASKYLEGYKDIHILLIGKDMDTSYHQELIRNSPLSGNIHLLGFQENVLSYLAACDISVLPSVKGEGLSKVTIESMSLHTPVVATDVGGNSELVINDDTGILVPPRSPEKIASGILKLRENQELTRNLGTRARMHIENNFHINDTTQQMKELYEEVAGQKNQTVNLIKPHDHE